MLCCFAPIVIFPILPNVDFLSKQMNLNCLPRIPHQQDSLPPVPFLLHSRTDAPIRLDYLSYTQGIPKQHVDPRKTLGSTLPTPLPTDQALLVIGSSHRDTTHQALLVAARPNVI